LDPGVPTLQGCNVGPEHPLPSVIILSLNTVVKTEEPFMAYQPNPNDPYRAGLSDEEIRQQARLNSLDTELQADPPLAEGRASGTKVAMFAVAVAVVMGALFYGLNNTPVNQAGTTPPSQTAQTTNPAAPTAPSGMRDVTPRANTESGVTTGAAPSRPTPQSSTDLNKNTPADKQ
jgi:hypothetical protein